MAGQSFTKEQLAEYKEVFCIFDKNGDGSINMEELGIALRALGQNPTRAELQKMIKDADRNGNGCLEFDEFLVMMNKQTKDAVCTEDELRKAFKVFDKDGSGTINAEELRYAMLNMGERLSEIEVQAMLDDADINGDGVIDCEEFILMMTAK